MPYKSEQIRIAGTKHDLRKKITDEQAKAIKILSSEGYSQRQIARMFGCSKSIVQHILNPKPRLSQKQYPTEYCTAAKRRYRMRKQELYKSGAFAKKCAHRNKRNEESEEA